MDKMKECLDEASFTQHIIYPEKFGGYIMFMAFGIACCIVLLGFSISYGRLSAIEIAFIALLTIITINFIITTLYLKAKRIYLEISNDYIEFKTAYRTRIIKFDDIDSIYTYSFRNLLHYIFIFRNRHGSKDSNRAIIFPMSWFSSTDMDYMLSFLKEQNGNIIFDGFDLELDNK